MQIDVKKLHADAVVPVRKTALASGFDLHAVDVVRPDQIKNLINDDFESYVVQPFERVFIHTGIAVQMCKGMEAQTRPRSGLALKNGIYVHLGTIDADYTGEIGVILINFDAAPFTITKGDRIAQLIFAPVFHDVVLNEVAELGKTERGEDGFGSTGVKGECA